MEVVERAAESGEARTWEPEQEVGNRAARARDCGDGPGSWIFLGLGRELPRVRKTAICERARLLHQSGETKLKPSLECVLPNDVRQVVRDNVPVCNRLEVEPPAGPAESSHAEVGPKKVARVGRGVG